MSLKTDITFILDRSGSMASVRQDAIGGFNAMIEDQKKQAGECTLSLVHFDTVFNDPDMPHFLGKPISAVEPLTDKTYIPRGGTALHDAMGRTINEVGARLAALPEADRPKKVIIVTITDGEENSSREFTAETVKAMIEHQREKYQWEFMYIGANQNAVEVAQDFGIPENDAISYAGNSMGTQAAYMVSSASLLARRSGGSGTFTSAARAAAMAGQEVPKTKKRPAIR